MQNQSVQPSQRTVINPQFNQARALIDGAASMRAIAQRINQLAREKFGTTVLTPLQRVELMSLLKAEKEQFIKESCAIVNHQDSPRQYAPKPPPRKELYGRIADGETVTDIGSGDCEKILTQQGRLKITAIDPGVSNLRMGVSFARQVEVEDLTERVTSFNALVQMPEPVIARALEVDGLHVIPDHDFLKIYGAAEDTEDGGVAVTVRTQDGPLVYVDRRINHPHYKVSPGYRLLASFQQQQWDLKVQIPKSGVNVEPYVPRSLIGPGNGVLFGWGDASWKWDGVFYELETYEDNVVLTGRDGSVERGAAPGVRRMCLHLEYMEEARCFVLLRVVMYNAMIPPHCLGVLNYFANRVKIKINGMPVYGPGDLSRPPVLNGVVCKVDGIIMREMEVDYYVKPRWTVDLDNGGLLSVMKKSSDLGFRLSVEGGGVRDGLWEYSVLKDDGQVILTPIRPRVDKLSGTSLGVFERILGLPTLSELIGSFGGDMRCEMIELYAL